MPMSQLRMREQVGSMVGRVNPLTGRTHWGVVVAEGVVLLALGIFILAQPQQASVGLVQLVGGFLLVTSVIAIYGLLRGTGEPASSPGRWIRVGIGLIAGLIGLVHPWLGTIDTAAAATVLAIGLVLVGVIGLYATIVTSQTFGWRWEQVILYAIYLILGSMVFYRNLSGSQFWLVPVLGWLATLGGVALCGFGFWLYRRRNTQLVAATAATAMDTPAPMADAVADAEIPLPTPATDAPSSATPSDSQQPPAPSV